MFIGKSKEVNSYNLALLNIIHNFKFNCIFFLSLRQCLQQFHPVYRVYCWLFPASVAKPFCWRHVCGYPRHLFSRMPHRRAERPPSQNRPGPSHDPHMPYPCYGGFSCSEDQKWRHEELDKIPRRISCYSFFVSCSFGIASHSRLRIISWPKTDPVNTWSSQGVNKSDRKMLFVRERSNGTH